MLLSGSEGTFLVHDVLLWFAFWWWVEGSTCSRRLLFGSDRGALTHGTSHAWVHSQGSSPLLGRFTIQLAQRISFWLRQPASLFWVHSWGSRMTTRFILPSELLVEPFFYWLCLQSPGEWLQRWSCHVKCCQNPAEGSQSWFCQHVLLAQSCMRTIVSSASGYQTNRKLLCGSYQKRCSYWFLIS